MAIMVTKNKFYEQLLAEELKRRGYYVEVEGLLEAEDKNDNKLIITITSGLNSDGFAVAISPNLDSKPIYTNRYNYGYTASYSRELANYSQQEHDTAIKYKWSRIPDVKPYTTDIIKDLMKKYNISKENIIVKVGKSVFSGKDLNSGEAKSFTDTYLNF